MRTRPGATGLGLATLSAASFGTSGTFAATLFAAGWTPAAAVIGRVLIAALILTIPALVVLHRRPAGLSRGIGTLTMYGLVAVAGCQLCYFNAIRHMSVAVALLVEYSGLLLVVGWLWLRHGQRPRLLTAYAAVAALSGLVLVLDLAGDHKVDVAGVLWGMGAAVGLAVYFVVSAHQKDALPPLVVAWGGLAIGGTALSVVGLAGALPLAAPRTEVTLLDTEFSWIVPMLGLSVIAAVLPYITGIAGVRLLGARVASFVGLLEVLFAVAFAWLLLGQGLTDLQLAGAALIVVGIALVRLDDIRASRDSARVSRQLSDGSTGVEPYVLAAE